MSYCLISTECCPRDGLWRLVKISLLLLIVRLQVQDAEIEDSFRVSAVRDVVRRDAEFYFSVAQLNVSLL